MSSKYKSKKKSENSDEENESKHHSESYTKYEYQVDISNSLNTKSIALTIDQIDPEEIEIVKVVGTSGKKYDNVSRKYTPINVEYYTHTYKGTTRFSFYPVKAFKSYGVYLPDFASADTRNKYQMSFRLYEDMENKQPHEINFEQTLKRIEENEVLQIEKLVKNKETKMLRGCTLENIQNKMMPTVYYKKVDKSDSSSEIDKSKSPVLYANLLKDDNGEFYAKFYDWNDKKKKHPLDPKMFEKTHVAIIPELQLSSTVISRDKIRLSFLIKSALVKKLKNQGSSMSNLPSTVAYDFDNIKDDVNSSDDSENENNISDTERNDNKKSKDAVKSNSSASSKNIKSSDSKSSKNSKSSDSESSKNSKSGKKSKKTKSDDSDNESEEDAKSSDSESDDDNHKKNKKNKKLNKKSSTDIEMETALQPYIEVPQNLLSNDDKKNKK